MCLWFEVIGVADEARRVWIDWSSHGGMQHEECFWDKESYEILHRQTSYIINKLCALTVLIK